MSEFDNISDEDLGCFIEEVFRETECDLTFDSISLEEDLRCSIEGVSNEVESDSCWDSACPNIDYSCNYFVEGVSHKSKSDFILDSISSDEDMEVLSIAYNASKLADAGTEAELKKLPKWNSGMIAACMPISALSAQLRQSAFLGDDNDEEDSEI